MDLSESLLPEREYRVRPGRWGAGQMRTGKPMLNVAYWDMGAGWKFLGEFKRGRRQNLLLECIVALHDRSEAEEIARKKLIGADTITVIELSRADLVALNIKKGDVRLWALQTVFLDASEASFFSPIPVGATYTLIGLLGRGNEIAERGLSQAIQIALAIGGAIQNPLSEFPFLRIVDWKG
jgi:hypothetical protein